MTLRLDDETRRKVASLFKPGQPAPLLGSRRAPTRPIVESDDTGLAGRRKTKGTDGANPDRVARVRRAREGGSPEITARTLTDERGIFQLDAPHAGLWTIRVEAAGSVPFEFELQPLIEPREFESIQLLAAHENGAPMLEIPIQVRCETVGKR